MQQMIDFNLFRLLAVLYEEQSVTRTAEKLFLTPSAVSHGLGRLRRLLSDPLFIRGSKGMIPTPRAKEIAISLSIILPQLYQLLDESDFDPKTSEQRFMIACLPFLTSQFIPGLLDNIMIAAPNVRVDVQLIHDNIVDELDSGQLDLAVGNFRRVPDRFRTEDLLFDDSVWVVRKTHPLASSKLTLKRLSKIPHVDALVGGISNRMIDSYDYRHGLERQVVHHNLAATEAAFARARLDREVRFRVPDSVAVMALVAQTDTAGLVPASLGIAHAEALGLAILRPPYPTTPINVQMLYHEEKSDRPAIRWFLDQVRRSGLESVICRSVSSIPERFNISSIDL